MIIVPDDQISRLLPNDAVMLLRRAASTSAAAGDEFERAKTIDHAVRTVRLKYSHLFKSNGTVDALS